MVIRKIEELMVRKIKGLKCCEQEKKTSFYTISTINPARALLQLCQLRGCELHRGSLPYKSRSKRDLVFRQSLPRQ